MDQKQTHNKNHQNKIYIGKTFSLNGKRKFIDNINLPEPAELYSKYTTNKTLNLQDPLNKKPLSQNEIQKDFLTGPRNNNVRNTTKLS